MESSAKKAQGVNEVFEKAMTICWPEGGAAKSGNNGNSDASGETPRKKKSGCTLL